MNFKFVRKKLVIGTMVGALGLFEAGMESMAYEIVDGIDAENAEAIRATAIEERTYGTFSFGSMDGYTYIYSEPSDEGDWIGKLYDDNKVSIISVEDEWVEIESGSVHGYVEGEYLLIEEDANIRSQELAVMWVIVDASRLNVRTGPGMDYEVIDVVEQGTEFLVVGSIEDGWQTVQHDGEVCYVSDYYVTEELAFSYAESKEEEAQRLEDYQNVVENYENEADDVEDAIYSSGESGTEEGSAQGQSVVEYAMQFIGNPYVWGGTDLVNGADCSGFVQSVYAHFGISLPRTSAEQRSAGTGVSYSDIQVGDIVCYDGHVGIYIGDGEIVNAIGSKYGIGISSATYSSIITVRRVL